MKNERLPLHKDTYFFGYGIDIEKPIDIANKNIELQQENKQLKIQISAREEEYKKLEDKLSKIETLIINHNCDTGDIYYKYNSKFLKSELKQRILEIVYEEGSDNNE